MNNDCKQQEIQMKKKNDNIKLTENKKHNLEAKMNEKKRDIRLIFRIEHNNFSFFSHNVLNPMEKQEIFFLNKDCLN